MGASDKDVKNRIFFPVIFLSPLDEDGRGWQRIFAPATNGIP